MWRIGGIFAGSVTKHRKGDVGGAGAVAVGDRRQALHVRPEHFGENLLLSLTQLRELRCNMRHGAMMLTDLNTEPHPARGGGVTGSREGICDTLSSTFDRLRIPLDGTDNRTHPAVRETLKRLLATDFPEFTHRCGSKVIVGVLQVIPPGCGQHVLLSWPASPTISQDAGRSDFRVTIVN